MPLCDLSPPFTQSFAVLKYTNNYSRSSGERRAGYNDDHDGNVQQRAEACPSHVRMRINQRTRETESHSESENVPCKCHNIKVDGGCVRQCCAVEESPRDAVRGCAKHTRPTHTLGVWPTHHYLLCIVLRLLPSGCTFERWRLHIR